MILGSLALALALRRGWIVCQPAPQQVGENSLAVSLGQFVARPRWPGKSCTDPYADEQAQVWELTEIPHGGLRLPPRELWLGHTEEFVGSVVSWLTPELRTRSTLACWGVSLGMAALCGEPGFRSRWRLQLYHAGLGPLLLRSGTKIGQVLFHVTIGGRLYPQRTDRVAGHWQRPYNVLEGLWRPEDLLPKHLELPVDCRRKGGQMDEWYGAMDWPVVAGWRCEVCGAGPEYLIWGLVHAQCRCDRCHTRYRMRDERRNVVTTPICQLKEEYYEQVKRGWALFQKPIDEWSDAEWREAKEAASKVVRL